ncbi:MarR family winged helix-turn-helix transcriptional regulator [Brevundimonas sp.]|uniref:MarR family winged helix-turn-helix transcriptional regulator n=1 Tax=Brevundimonas sp. TaxID=1871086 RepID=UPI0025BF7CCC|nr:MarR family transcriptional regulator [Brevundimonas sp.]MCG2664286.1 MarR family transcriptional regulator [Brevundimonas sp.]
MSKSKGPVPMEDQLCFTVYSTGMAIQRAYKPLLDDLGVTYPQYLVMNVLWREDGRTVGDIADELALEPSTMTPLLKRLEVAGLVRRARNPANERQVVITLTSEGQALRERAGCLGEALLDASGRTMPELSDLNIRLKSLRDAVYESLASRKSTQG